MKKIPAEAQITLFVWFDLKERDMKHHSREV